VSAKNGPLVRGVTTDACTIGGSKDDPEAGALTPGVPQGLALDPQQRRGLPPMVDESLDPCKTRVRKLAGRWNWSCPCGYHGSTKHHRLALLFAVEHAHRVEVAA